MKMTAGGVEAFFFREMFSCKEKRFWSSDPTCHANSHLLFAFFFRLVYLCSRVFSLPFLRSSPLQQ